jgi:hypothetical protein
MLVAWLMTPGMRICRPSIYILPNLPLMLVPGVRGLDRVALGVDLEYEVHDFTQGRVGCVREAPTPQESLGRSALGTRGRTSPRRALFGA